MPRPKKCRRVCCMPINLSFGPLDGKTEERQSIVMAIDEYEAIRLIDLEGLSQEGCSQRMGVARTTVQAIYNSARVKLAESLVGGIRLTIDGGDYVLCGSEPSGCGHHHGKRHHCEKDADAPCIAADHQSESEEK